MASDARKKSMPVVVGTGAQLPREVPWHARGKQNGTFDPWAILIGSKRSRRGSLKIRKTMQIPRINVDKRHTAYYFRFLFRKCVGTYLEKLNGTFILSRNLINSIKFQRSSLKIRKVMYILGIDVN